MVVKRELNARKCQNMSFALVFTFITIKIGNINDVIEEFEQNIAGVQKWKMVTHKLWVIV